MLNLPKHEKADDIMLFIARIILTIGEWLFALLGAIIVGFGALAATALLFGSGDAVHELYTEIPELALLHFAPWQMAGTVMIIVGLIGVIMLMLWQFIRRLRAILGTVKGDPFVHANAVRLREMGWIMVLIYVPGFLLTGFIYWLSVITNQKDFDGDFGFDPGHILIILLLFILARVFEQGVAMRDELEGTV